MIRTSFSSRRHRPANSAASRLSLALAITVVWLCSLLASDRAAAADLRPVAPFIRQHCLDCHEGDAAEAGLDLTRLGTKLDDQAAFAKWERIHDRVASGEMPPASIEAPAKAERQAFLALLGGELTKAHQAAKGTVLRRLNRREYENTMNDLFGTNLKLAERLPEDSRSHEFDNVGASLGISMVQLQRYLECAEDVLDEATAKNADPPESKITRASYADTRGAEQWLGKIWLHRDDGAVVFFKSFGYPSGMLREANVARDGWYKVRVTGYAYQSDAPITFAIGATTFARGAEMPTFGYFSMPPGKPTTVELKAWIGARYMIDITPQGLFDRDNEIRRDGIAGYKGPGLAIQHVEIEGPLTDEFPTRGHRLVFEGLDRREIMPRNPNERKRPNYVGKFEIASRDPAADVTPVLTRVASRAFRRPVPASQVETYVELFKSELAKGSTFEESLRASVMAIFCSPDFLYLKENPGRLDDFALATRLAYFLTRTAPDDELLAAAADGKLTSDRAVLLAQTQRLLDDPRSDRFVTDLTDAWLNLREIDFTNPDSALFPEFDRYLQHSMVDETRAYFRQLVADNLGARNIVKSDFAMLNDRLAEHYGIDGVTGPEIRAVTLPPDSVRGGFLSQASVLKVSANGTNTSPVVRGVWVMERILGQAAPPPPAGVPGVEPDIRGATTLRELLDKHRSLDSCRGCHRAIDPPGFALESFNPIGGWRERFRSLGEGDRVETLVNGGKVRYRLGPPVDSSGQLADGRPFADFREFRDLLASDERGLAKSLLTKLLTFSTGREMGFSDRAEIERLVDMAAKRNYGVRDLILLTVNSEIFRHK
ncbi:MAG: DUF1592 domain-containing protein [Pirellulaceae bacterium]